MVGVFDGHGGERVSQYLAENFSQRFLAHYSAAANLPSVFRETFAEIDCELEIMAAAKQLYDTEGSTATVVLLVNDDLYLAYVGDSAAMLVRGGDDPVLKLCAEIDTALGNAKEVERVEHAGGVVIKGRVLGELALTRAFGDSKYKAYVPAEPHVVHQRLEEGTDQFLVLASDGLWNVLDEEEAAEIVQGHAAESEDGIAEALHAAAVNRNCRDNVTIVVVNIEKRRAMSKHGSVCPSAAPTSRYARTGTRGFNFGDNETPEIIE